MIFQSERQVYVTVADEFQQEVTVAWLENVLTVALEHALDPGEPGEVSLLLTGDEEIRYLNREYRGLDEVTDVLSFSAIHQGHWEGEGFPTIGPDSILGIDDEDAIPGFVLPPNELPPLGDIIVSYPQTCRQARDLERPVDRELALLAVHGVLHLMGHDHLEPEETAQMQALEQAALAQIFADLEELP